MMLYHGEPNQGCGRVLIYLKERRIRFQSCYIDALVFEQHASQLLGLDVTGELPILLDHNEAFTEPTDICEYLEETYGMSPLLPDAPFSRWRIRHWQKHVDESLRPAVSRLAWNASGRCVIARLGFQRVLEAIARIPSPQRRRVWQEAVSGYSGTQLKEALDKVHHTVSRMEADLAHSLWLCGDAFSLADITLFPFINYAPQIFPELVNSATAPRTASWLRRAALRPAVREALCMARTPDPFASGMPGPEETRWG